mmetsp:Transcript_14439/g.17553  ORF Transcript_14439/g.17553 Transcript_14439/m.17553 type:complete len:229 (+) Transcript_14439:41-727(+)
MTTEENRRISLLNPPLDSNSFATTKYTWEDLTGIILHQRFPIYRHVEMETTYRLYSQKLKREWKSVYDFILHCKFNFERKLSPVDQKIMGVQQSYATSSRSQHLTNAGGNTLPGDMNTNNLETLPNIPSPPQGYVWEAYPYISDKCNQTTQRILARNDFPYYFEDGIDHWCLWKLGPDDVTEDDIEWGKEELKMKFDDVLELQHWINPEHLKSLPGIDHAHLICLRRR